MAQTLITFDECIKRTSLSKSTILRHVKRGAFPKPVAIGERRKAFVEDEVSAWINGRVEARDTGVSDEL